MKKPMAIAWAVLLVVALSAAIYYLRTDRTASILNLVLVLVSGFGLRRQLRHHPGR